MKNEKEKHKGKTEQFKFLAFFPTLFWYPNNEKLGNNAYYIVTKVLIDDQ